MPIYEYQCPDCGNDFELMQKIGAEAPACGRCGGTRVAKKVSRTSFVLKGGGWYKDGYSGASNQKGGGSAGAASESSAPKSEPAPKAESAPASAPAAPSTPSSTTT